MGKFDFLCHQTQNFALDTRVRTAAYIYEALSLNGSIFIASRQKKKKKSTSELQPDFLFVGISQVHKTSLFKVLLHGRLRVF